MPQLPLPPSSYATKYTLCRSPSLLLSLLPKAARSFVVIVVVALVVTVARGATAVDSIEDDATKGGGGEGVPEGEVAAESGILGRVAVVEFR